MSSDEIVKEFNLEEQKLNKFAVQESKPSSKEADKKDIKDPKKDTKLKIKVVPKKKKATKKIEKPTVEKVVIKDADEVKPKVVELKPRKDKGLKKIRLPEGYPQKFVDYDKKSAPVWKLFDPIYFENEQMKLKIAYMGVTAGYLDLITKPVVKISGKDAFHFSAYMKSADYYSYIYALDDKLDSIISLDGFKPMKFTMIQRESSQSVDDLQFFDHELLKTYSFYRKDKKGKVSKKQKEVFIPRYFNDSFSAIYFVRGLPLRLNDTYSFPIVTRGKVWIMKLEVVSVNEEIEVEAGEFKAIKIKAETHFSGVLKKRGDIEFWYSNDKERKLLKFKAKVKIGSIDGELIKYSPGNGQ